MEVMWIRAGDAATEAVSQLSRGVGACMEALPNHCGNGSGKTRYCPINGVFRHTMPALEKLSKRISPC